MPVGDTTISPRHVSASGWWQIAVRIWHRVGSLRLGLVPPAAFCGGYNFSSNQRGQRRRRHRARCGRELCVQLLRSVICELQRNLWGPRRRHNFADMDVAVGLHRSVRWAFKTLRLKPRSQRTTRPDQTENPATVGR